MNQKTEERKPINLIKEEVTANRSYIDKTTGQRVCKPIGSVGEEVYPKVAEPKVVHPTKTIGEERVDNSVCSESKKEEKDEENDANFDNYCDYSISEKPTSKVNNLFLEYIKRRPVDVLVLFVALMYGLILHVLGATFVFGFLAICVACCMWCMISDLMYLFMPPIRALLTSIHKENLISSEARDLVYERERQATSGYSWERQDKS